MKYRWCISFVMSIMAALFFGSTWILPIGFILWLLLEAYITKPSDVLTFILGGLLVFGGIALTFYSGITFFIGIPMAIIGCAIWGSSN